ncbi:hypothetical protein IW16_23350 [Chryseobacterium vrystaatense]|uniref:Uncharacterized protein n=1 Tax=Chryseobacterium vrystaatense TaxID=307480 RepID=A0ABR4UH07_9FLAO|nr:hypothetical protein IW16_23350 [Chryseobacterium vrystaatense]
MVDSFGNEKQISFQFNNKKINPIIIGPVSINRAKALHYQSESMLIRTAVGCPFLFLIVQEYKVFFSM